MVDLKGVLIGTGLVGVVAASSLLHHPTESRGSFSAGESLRIAAPAVLARDEKCLEDLLKSQRPQTIEERIYADRVRIACAIRLPKNTHAYFLNSRGAFSKVVIESESAGQVSGLIPTSMLESGELLR
jgi:hypothetical protein